MLLFSLLFMAEFLCTQIHSAGLVLPKALDYGDLAKVREIISKGKTDLNHSNVKSKLLRERICPLLLAVRKNRSDIAIALIEANADITTVHDRLSPLPIYEILNSAVAHLNTRVVQSLVDCKAEISLKNDRGRNIFRCAVLSNANAIVKLLLTAGANMKDHVSNIGDQVRSWYIRDSLFNTAVRNQNLELVEIFQKSLMQWAISVL
jgi:ankyrin repeat protein